MESCIKQNNAIEIYQDYFNEIDEATDCEEPKAKVQWYIIIIIISINGQEFSYPLDLMKV